MSCAARRRRRHEELGDCSVAMPHLAEAFMIPKCPQSLGHPWDVGRLRQDRLLAAVAEARRKREELDWCGAKGPLNSLDGMIETIARKLVEASYRLGCRLLAV